MKKRRKLIFSLIAIILVSFIFILVIKNIITDRQTNLSEDDIQLIEQSFEIARSYFPELSDTKINLKYTNLNKRTLNARPKADFIFLSKERREYNIIVNNKYEENALILTNYSTDATIGILGHELSHIMDYKEKTSGEMIIFGSKYLLFRSYKQEVEKKTDRIALNHGIGEKIYEATLFQYNNKEYWKDKEDVYYTPEELLVLMREME